MLKKVHFRVWPAVWDGGDTTRKYTKGQTIPLTTREAGLLDPAMKDANPHVRGHLTFDLWVGVKMQNTKNGEGTLAKCEYLLFSTHRY